MAKHKVITTDEEIHTALGNAKVRDQEPVAQTVEHIPGLNLLIIGLSNKRRLVLPVEDLQGLENASDQHLRNYELLGRGTGISFPDLDADFYVPALIEGQYGTRRWMAQIGKRGGNATSHRKRDAARVNGAKGGRPKKTALVS